MQAAMDTLRSKFSTDTSLADPKGRVADKPAGSPSAPPPDPGKTPEPGGDPAVQRPGETGLELEEGDPNEPAAPPAKPAKETEDGESALDGKATLDGKKVSPWKLADHYKKSLIKTQAELAELRSDPGKHPEFKAVSEKIKALEARNSELEEEMRYTNYQKHPEFIERYQKPYQEAWSRAVSGLKGLQLQQANPESGEIVAREITPQDIAAFAGMDAAAARQHIKALLPDPSDASEVRAYVDKIRDLAITQQSALNEQRKVAGDREKTRNEEGARLNREFSEEISQTFKQHVAEASQKYEFLRPIEGDDDHNAALERATKLVDDALHQRPTPKMSKDERAAAVKKHAAVRMRAIAYSPLKLQNTKLKVQISELQKSLDGYKSSEPGAGGGGAGKGTVPVDAMSSAIQSLRGLAGRR